MKSILNKSCLFVLALLALTFSAIGVTPAYAAATFAVTNLNDSGAGSLRQAITNANNIGGADTIIFGVSGTITLASALPNLIDTAGLTIDGTGENVTISGHHTARVFTNSIGLLTVKNLTIANGYDGGLSAGGIYNANILIVTNCVFSGNSADAGNGGAIYNDGGSASITNSTFSGNSAIGGAGIYSNGGTLTVVNSTFSANNAGSGGGIYNAGGALTITNNSIFGNTATAGKGGGIYNDGGTLTITNSLLSTNSAFDGGSIYIKAGQITVTNSTFSKNGAADVGAGVFNATSGSLSITGSTFSGNSAIDGGGIYNLNNTLTTANSTFVANSASGYGGGIYNSSGPVRITNSTFSANSAPANGGGGVYSAGGILIMVNTIVANSITGGNCQGTITNWGNNIDDGISCGWGSTSGSMSSTNPLLGTLTGSPAYFPLKAGSPALNAGNDIVCAASPVDNQSQNGLTRPQGKHCEIGSYEAEGIDPTVVSIVRSGADPTSAANVGFTVTFSEAVLGVTVGDFSPTSTGVTGAVVAAVTGGPTVYNVTVNTGSGDGTIRLDIPASASGIITDLSANPLAGLPYTGGEVYTVNKTLTFVSNGAQDGWVLESGELSNKGGSINKVAKTFNLGDDAAKRQYRGILSFSTGAGLPDTAVITGVTLMVRKSAVVGVGNPLAMFKGLMVDIKNGFFGTSAALQTGDFQAKASQSLGPFLPVPVSGWYSIDLTPAGASVNKLSTGGGLTQMRLRFMLDDNNNAVANYLALFSGNAAVTNRPQLIITYYVP